MELGSKRDKKRGCENSQLPICWILGSLLVNSLQGGWLWGLRVGVARPQGCLSEQVHWGHTASVSLIPGNWVNESPGQGVLGCRALRIPSTRPTSFLWPQSSLCTSSPAHPTFPPQGRYCAGLLTRKASPLHPGVAIHLGSHPCPFQPEATPGLLTLLSPQPLCPVD